MFKAVPLAVIGDRYELQRELARGGMGSVWVAKDRKLRRSVAIKVMVPMWVESDNVTKRFELEAMAVARLQSPHIVQIFDYGVHDGCPFIVMELLEGEDLRQRLQRRERLDLETAGRILIQVAKALSEAHANGIVHRDLKPGNIFLAMSRDEEIAKVLDFGVAKAELGTDQDEKTKAGTVLGTPQYMSPEQARSLPDIDHRADLWSLAVIIYRALVGRLPFVGNSAADIIVKICTQTPTKPTVLAPDLPHELDRFFARAFARDPNQRFSSARQMAIAFSRIAPASFPSLSSLPPGPFSSPGSGRWPATDTVSSRSSRPPPMPPSSRRSLPSSGRFVPPPPRSTRPSVPESAPLSDGLFDVSSLVRQSTPPPLPSTEGLFSPNPISDPVNTNAGASIDLSAPLSTRDLETPASLPAASGQPSLGPGSSTLASTEPSRRRRPLAWIAAIVVVAGLAVLVVFGIPRWSGEPAGETDPLTPAAQAAEPPTAEPAPSPPSPEPSPEQTDVEIDGGAAEETTSAAPPTGYHPPPHWTPPRPTPKPTPSPTKSPTNDPFQERL